MNKLFMVYMGGSTAGAHIELHDIRFVVGATIEATYGQLKRQWFGDKNSAHMDSYVHVHHVDGFKIESHAIEFGGLLNKLPARRQNKHFVQA